MLESDTVFLQESSDLVRLLACRGFAVIPDPRLGIYFVRPLELRVRAAYTIGVSAAAVRRACEDGLIAPKIHDNGDADEIVYLLTARGRRRFAVEVRALEATRSVVSPLNKVPGHALERRLTGGTTRGQTIATTFGNMQSTFAQILHIISQKVHSSAG